MPVIDASDKRLRTGLILLVAALWLGLCNQLRVEWSINSQYSYGWGVPLLGLYLFWKRWQCRPDPQPGPTPTSAALAALVLLSLLLPVRLIEEANPDWRPVSWLYALMVTSLTWLAVWYTGGRAWGRHFFVPIVFMLVAVPWPTPIEEYFIQGLMRDVAGATVEALNWLGIPAVQQGNLIKLPSGVIGVSEACSGVRSFQATLMSGIFLGELYRFGRRRRLLFVFLAAAMALVFNFVRTFALTWIGVRNGTSSLLSWHDPAGYFVWMLAFFVLWIIAARWRGARFEVMPAPSVRGSRPRRLPALALITVAVWLLAVEGLTAAWYRSHESGLVLNRAWTLEWPKQDPGFHFEPIPEEVRLILRFNTGQNGVWDRKDGTRWLMYYFKWSPGRAAAQLAANHSPVACLPASGLTLVSEDGWRKVAADGLELPFHGYVFDNHGEPWHVYFCLWEDRFSVQNGPERGGDFGRWSRLKAVLDGRRHLGQEVLEIAILGAHDPATAMAQMRAELPKMIHLR